MANVYASLINRMDYLIERQGVVSGNIANATTPGYLTKDLEFSGLVDQKSNSIHMATTSGSHQKGFGAATSNFGISEDRINVRHDGNSVKMDTEMLKLQETQMNYRLATQLYAKNKSMQVMALGRGQ
jgi:flagellar basal-body rod protein FlgB